VHYSLSQCEQAETTHGHPLKELERDLEPGDGVDVDEPNGTAVIPEYVALVIIDRFDAVTDLAVLGRVDHEVPTASPVHSSTRHPYSIGQIVGVDVPGHQATLGLVWSLEARGRRRNGLPG
jgi:hypothetical protein